MLTLEAYFGQHAADAAPGELLPEYQDNAADLLPRVTALLAELGITSPVQRSGWRPAATNAATANAAAKSKHMTGNAVDVADNDGSINAAVTDAMLEAHGLWRESPAACPTWCHMQNLPPHSGKRTYFP